MSVWVCGVSRMYVDVGCDAIVVGAQVSTQLEVETFGEAFDVDADAGNDDDDADADGGVGGGGVARAAVLAALRLRRLLLLP